MKNHKKVCIVLNYIKQWLISVSAFVRHDSISAFASLIGVSIDIVVLQKY